MNFWDEVVAYKILSAGRLPLSNFRGFEENNGFIYIEKFIPNTMSDPWHISKVSKRRKMNVEDERFYKRRGKEREYGGGEYEKKSKENESVYERKIKNVYEKDTWSVYEKKKNSKNEKNEGNEKKMKKKRKLKL